MSFLEELIKASHRPLASQPESYGVFHLSFVALSLIVIITLCYLMRKNSDTVFRIVMFSLGACLLLSEAYKQLYYLYAAGGEGYDWYIFPFQLCSVPMYLSIVVGCMKKNKVRDAVCEYLVSIGLLGGIMAYVEPSGILNAHYFTLIHSCLWHAMLIFIALYILVTGNACRRLADYRKAIGILAVVVLTATALNVAFYEKPSFNMCYISPFYPTPLAVFSSFDTFFQGILGQYPGRIVSALIYVVALVLGGFILYFVAWLFKGRTRSADSAYDLDTAEIKRKAADDFSYSRF